MEEDFPRGAVIRRATRSTDENKKCFVQLGVKRSLEDVLFKDSEQATPSKGKKKKTKKSEGEETDEPDLEEEFEGATETEGFIPKTLTSKTLSEGMLVLAVVQEIHEYEIVLSLPNGQTAFVQITDVSSFFTQQLQELNESNGAEDQDLPNIQDVYQVGNLVPCKVKSLGASKDGHRRIQASLDYKEVNSELGISFIKAGMTLHGCVSSVEDHGYTIDLGIRGTNAFLAKEEATKGAKGRKGEAMKTGKLVTCLVKAVKANGRSIILTFDPERLKSCKATKTTHTTFSSLIPGTRLDAMVTKVLSNSLIMDIFGLYKGCVDPIHLKDTVDELAKYDIGQKLVAVVLYNCPTTKSIGLSLNPAHHKTTFDPATDVIRDLSPGDIIEAALVVRVQEKENLIVQLNPKTRGIVYHSHGSDDKQKRYSPASVGEKVRCRILSFNLFDRLAIVSMRKSILDKPFLGINDVKPGMLVKGVIESVMSRGVAVKIQDRIHGFVPRTHLADIPVQKPQERFTIGSEIELRVLLVEPAKRRVLLTHKKTMVKSSLPFLASYAQPKLGMWIHGCVVAVKDFGCIVSFYNDVKGIIPRAELGMDESSSPTDNFYVGQVLKCRVLRTHSPESKKLALSLRKDGRKERESFEAGKHSATEISHLERLGRERDRQIEEPEERDRQIEEPEEGNESDLLDEEENATREIEEERRREAKKEEEKNNKRKKIKEIDMDTQSQIDYFQEIAESLKAFACMMVDMKVVKVEIRNIKSMLQELTGKKNRDRERVREDNAREEQWKNRDRERVREDNAREEQWKNRDRERVREDTARYKQQRYRDRERVRDDNAREEQPKNRDRERVREDNAREEQPKEREGGKMDAGRVILENDYRTHVNMGEDENYFLEESDDDEAEGFVDILGDNSASDSGHDGFGIEERGARSTDEDSVRSDKMGEEDSRSDARIGVSEQYKEDLGQETISGKTTSSERVTMDVEKACSKRRMVWEKLSMGVICHLYERAITKGNFARSVLRKLVDDDILVKSTCLGKGGRPNEQAIDPDILRYALETTYDVYGIEEHEQEKCRRECVQSIDSHCRQLSNSLTKKPSNREGMSERKAQGTEMLRNGPVQKDGDMGFRKDDVERRKEGAFESVGGGKRDVAGGSPVKGSTWQRLSDKEVIGIRSGARTMTNFVIAFLGKIVGDEILVNSNCSGLARPGSGRPNVKRIDPDIFSYICESTFNAYGIKECDKKKCIKKCITCIDARCRYLFWKKCRSKSTKGTTDASMNESVPKDGRFESRHDVEKERVQSATGNDTDKDSEIENIEEEIHWESLSDEDIIDIRTKARSRGDFAKSVMRKIVGDEILVNRNCSGLAGSNSGRPNVKRIDPDIMSYTFETTFNVYGVEECDKKKCIKECTTSINAHCRYLFWKKCAGKSRKGTTDASMIESVSKDGRFKSRHVEKKRVQSATGNDDSNKDGEIESIEGDVHWESLSDEDIIDIHTRARSRGDFAKSVLRKIVGDGTLINSSSSSVDPDILSYVIRSTHDVYGVLEAEKTKCHSECLDAIDSYCKYLRDNR